MAQRFLSILFAAIISLFAMLAMAQAANRAALVIGNSAYPFGPLANPKNDAELMAATLKQVGFEVTTVLDADRQTMQKALLDFSRAIRDTDTVGLFYFAGHGVQSAGENYLVPIDADIKSESEVKLFTINVDEFVATLERANGRTNIVILDSCRNNPFPKISRSGARGLAAVNAPTGTFIAQSTSPGQVALDGAGDNSPYAAALAKSILTPGATIEQVFKVTRRIVLKETNEVQTPWDTSSLTGDFFFTEALPEALTPAIVPAPKQPIVTAEPEVPATDEQPAEPSIAEEPQTVPTVEEEPQIAINAEPPQEKSPAIAVQEISPQPRIYPVGKWPEGLVQTGDKLWIAESGSKRIVKLNRESGVIEVKVPVGRLPVSLATDENGNIYSAAFTDGKITRQAIGGTTKVITTIKSGFLNDMRYGGGSLFAVTHTEDAERTSTLTRINPQTGKTAASDAFVGEARGLTVAEGTPFVLYQSNGTMEIAQFDRDALTKSAGVPLKGFIWSIGSNKQFIYAGGRAEQQAGASMVTQLQIEDLGNKTEQVLEGQELITVIVATDIRVAALGNEGGVWILDAASLTPLKHFNSGVTPQAAIFADSTLYITTNLGGSDAGAVYAFEGLLD